MRFLPILLLTFYFFAHGEFSQAKAQNNNYTPPPMFGAPVAAPVQAAPAPATPVPLTPTPQKQNPALNFEKREAHQQQQKLNEWGLAGDAHDVPTPILQTPNSEEQKKLAAQQLRERGKIPPISAESLLEFPVNAPPLSAPAAVNDPILKSSAAINQLPKPKDGERIDDTGVPDDQVRRPNKPIEKTDGQKKTEESKSSPLPQKPKLKEDAPKKTPPKRVKEISSETIKMPIVKNKEVAEIPLAPMANVKIAPPEKNLSKDKNNVGTSSLNFSKGLSELSATQKTSLQSLIAHLNKNSSAKVVILSYATPTNATGTVSAKRIALTRGLAVRGYLMEAGIKAERVALKALGDTKKELDRIDIRIME